MTVIETRKLTRRYGDLTAVDSLSLKVDEGEFFGLIGPNGAGKTTLVKLLTGQIQPSSGTARVAGCDVLRSPLDVRRRVGIVPEAESPPSFLTAGEYLTFVARLRGMDSMAPRRHVSATSVADSMAPRRHVSATSVADADDGEAAVRRIIEYFGLKKKRDSLCKDLSKGMRQRLSIAAALLHEPPLLFLDEPFINLDPIHQVRLRERLAAYSKSGGTVFLCTHILEIAERLCTRVAVMNHGKVVASASVSEMRVSGKRLEDLFLASVGDGDGLEG